ncbi:unnamed protein product [Linum trigynum]|uniref:Uncharacterized protein n=1 Tax=Linum trigynum TaxID=586398 RepID=A0AAV2GIJ9_9ROSI
MNQDKTKSNIHQMWSLQIADALLGQEPLKQKGEDIMTEKENQEVPTVTPILTRLDRLDRMLQFLEDKYLVQEKPKTEAAVKVTEDHQCMSLSAALELVKQKGSVVERLEFLENRILQLSLEMEVGNNSTSRSSSAMVTEPESGDDDHKHLIVKQEPKKAPNLSMTQKGTRQRRVVSSKKWAAGLRWLHMGCNS